MVLGIPGIEEVDSFLAILALGNVHRVELNPVASFGVVNGVSHFVVPLLVDIRFPCDIIIPQLS